MYELFPSEDVDGLFIARKSDIVLLNTKEYGQDRLRTASLNRLAPVTTNNFEIGKKESITEYRGRKRSIVHL